LLNCNTSPSSMSMIHRFGLLIVSQRPYMFHSYFIFFLFSSSDYSNKSILSLLFCLQFDSSYWRNFPQGFLFDLLSFSFSEF
jgi:hypothetical protein